MNKVIKSSEIRKYFKSGDQILTGGFGLSMSKESLLLAERANSIEGKEGISAFLEKREADYLKH
ncbi:hypothetical protein [Peribacillus asahii]|uniref:hypothetical protein n=1 Tax=Peribacillus asahii TaxID=228899 RepID=UPI00207A466C|nr:hypothetical protein [Peribacillus asahii]USK62506.1 hypothetical protein LIT37_24945 [Peribacillus asahii]